MFTLTWAGQLQYNTKLHMRICTVSALHFLPQSNSPPIVHLNHFVWLSYNSVCYSHECLVQRVLHLCALIVLVLHTLDHVTMKTSSFS